MNFSQILGFVGTGVVIIAYVPQIHHVIKEHCSAGISIKAYGLWFIASILFLIHASMIRDLVFIIVQIANLAAICVVVVCTKKYERQVCRIHRETHLKEPQQVDQQRS